MIEIVARGDVFGDITVCISQHPGLICRVGW